MINKTNRSMLTWSVNSSTCIGFRPCTVDHVLLRFGLFMF